MKIKDIILLSFALMFSVMLNAQNNNADQAFLEAVNNAGSGENNLASDFTELLDALKLGANINVTDSAGNTAVHIGTKKRNIDVLKILYYNKADFSIKNNQGKTVLEVAQNMEYANSVKKFLKNPQLDNSFYTKFGKLDEIKNIVSKNPEAINKPDRYGRSLLYYASARNDNALEIVKYLVGKGAQINTSYLLYVDVAIEKSNLDLIKYYVGKTGKTITACPLNIAIRNGNPEIVKFLIKSGANPNKPDDWGNYPIIFASQTLNYEIIKILIDNKANLEVKNWNDETPLITICSEAKNFDKESDVYKSIKAFVDAGANLNAKNNYNKTALYFIAETDTNSELTKYLIENGANLNIKSNDDINPLMNACKNPNGAEIAKYLFDKNDKSKFKTDDLNRLLHLSVSYHKSTSFAEYLLKNGASAKSFNDYQVPLIYEMSKNPNGADFFEILVNAGADLKTEVEYSGNILHSAAEYGNLKLVKLLITKGFDINSANSQKETPLNKACSNSNRHNIEVIDFLIKSGTDINQLNNQNESSLYNVVYYNNKKAVKLLIKAGAKLDFISSTENTALDIAVKDGNFEMIKLLVDAGAEINASGTNTGLYYAVNNNKKEIFDYLIENGAKIGSKNEYYNNPLLEALEKKYYYYANILIDIGADINASDYYGKTPLIFVCEDNNLELIKKILAQKPKVNSSAFTKSALHISAKNPNGYQAVKLLIENGANPYAYDENGKSALDYAIASGNQKTISLLKEKTNISVKKRKNMLISDKLIMCDKIALNTSHYNRESPGKLEIFYDSLYYNSENFSTFDIRELMIKKLSAKNTKTYIDYKPYDNFFPYAYLQSNEETNKKLGFGNKEVYITDEETGEEYPVEIEREAQKNEFSAIEFYDQWIFDEENFKMYKKTLAYAPIRKCEKEMEGGEYYKITDETTGFLVFNDFVKKKDKKKSDARMKLFKKVKYEYYLENIETNLNPNEKVPYEIEKENCLLWSSFGRDKLRKLLVNNALYGNKNAYDFYTGKKMSFEEIKTSLTGKADTVIVFDEDTYEDIKIIEQNELDLKDIKSVIFIENWYIDTLTMRIKKEIKGIAPVITKYKFSEATDDYEEDGLHAEKHKKICYVIYFDENRLLQKKSEARKIEIRTPLNNTGELEDGTMYNLNFFFEAENIPEINFTKLYLDKINSEQIPAYKPAFVDAENYIQSAFCKKNYAKLNTKEIADKQAYLKKEEKKSENGEIVGLRTFENWNFDNDNFTFTKEVIAYSPFITYSDKLGEYMEYKLLGDIIAPKNGNKEDYKLFKKVKYEVGFTDFYENTGENIPDIEQNTPLFWSNFNNIKIRNIIFDKITSKQVEIFDFETGKILSAEKINKKIILFQDTIMDIDPETGEEIPLYIEKKLKSEFIKSFIFIENWYINPKTLALRKKVIGIAPCFYFIDEETEDNKKEIPFIIYF